VDIACGIRYDMGIYIFTLILGWEILHSVASVLGVYSILRIIGGTLISVICVFIFTMAYLLAGEYSDDNSMLSFFVVAYT
jgi:hypothetical protein